MITLLADESVDFQLVRALREAGFDLISILEDSPGISDLEVLRLALDKNALNLSSIKNVL